MNTPYYVRHYMRRGRGFALLAMILAAALLPISVPSHALSIPVPASKPALKLQEPAGQDNAKKDQKAAPADANTAPAVNASPAQTNQIQRSAHIHPVPLRKPTDIAAQARLSTAEDFGRPEKTGQAATPQRKPLSSGINGLSAEDAQRYKTIFTYQQHGDWEKADAEIAKLNDYFLRGHVLYQRYMHPAKYRSSFKELRGWLDLYNDHPGAHKIYKLALSRAPQGYTGGLNKPDLGRVLRGVHPDLRDIQSFMNASYIDSGRSRSARQKVDAVNDKVQGLLRRGGPTAALRTINAKHNRALLSDMEYAHLQAQIAATYLHLGYWDKAKSNAVASVKLSKGRATVGAWIAGLIAWKDRDYGAAAAYFEEVASVPAASPWTIAAGGYWAARAHMRTGNFAHVTKWLEIAARYPRTFYGAIAIRAMGGSFKFNWDTPQLTPALQRALMAHKGALRAMALMQAGQVHLAEEELKHIHPRDNTRLREALLAYARQVGLPAYQMRFASIFKAPNGHFYDAALFPLAPWQKQRKTNRGAVDTAVLNAFIRQESRFRSGAENASGATGLMQIMPSTANYVMGTQRFEGAGRERLKDPYLNMQIGETYIYNLLNQDVVGQDLFSLAIAYNAGPGNLRRWKEERRAQNLDALDDPLFFIETIPVSETRSFVERVMTNIWIYRMQLGQPTPSLDAVAEGTWPLYIAMDDQKTRDYAFIKRQDLF